jgi:ABC-2 type transport system permease protein
MRTNDMRHNTLRTAGLWTRVFLRQSFREFQIAALFLLFPALMVYIYWGAFGASGSGFSGSLAAIVVSGDLPGAAPAPSSAPSAAGGIADRLTEGGTAAERLTAAMRAESFEGKPALRVYESDDLAASMKALRNGEVTLVVDARETGEGRATLYVDPASGLGAYAEAFARAAAARAFARPGTDEGLFTEAHFSSGSGSSRDFLFGVPGLVVFGWAFGLLAIALLLVREIDRGTMERIAMSESGVLPLVLGLWGLEAILGLAQALLVTAVALVLGFPLPHNAGNLVAAVLVLNGLMAGVALGFGLLTAAWAKSEGAAMSLSMVFIGPLAFLSGALFPLPAAGAVKIGGFALSANDLIPTTGAVRVLSDSLVRGMPLLDDWPSIAVFAVETILILAIAAAVFSRKRLGPAGQGAKA